VEFRALVESKRNAHRIVPVAATEQHLHHLEMSTDCTEVEFVIRKAPRKWRRWPSLPYDQRRGVGAPHETRRLLDVAVEIFTSMSSTMRRVSHVGLR